MTGMPSIDAASYPRSRTTVKRAGELSAIRSQLFADGLLLRADSWIDMNQGREVWRRGSMACRLEAVVRFVTGQVTWKAHYAGADAAFGLTVVTLGSRLGISRSPHLEKERDDHDGRDGNNGRDRDEADRCECLHE
jgi:hypothetical protein